MAEFRMTAVSRARAGRRDELATWYDGRRIPDLLRVSGIVSADRSTLQSFKKPDGTADWDFPVTHRIEADDPAAMLAETGRRLGTDEMPVSDALDRTGTLAPVANPTVATAG